MTTLPISPDLFWGLVTLGGIVFAMVVIYAILIPADSEATAPLDRVKEKLGLAPLNSGLFLIAAFLWAAVFLLLTGGIIVLIWQIIWNAPTTKPEEVWNWRFTLAQLTVLTATLGAVVALPFTLVRLTLSREQNRHAEDVLFNDKVTEATRDLYARRQVTKGEDRASAYDVWEDDITRRNAAIDQLERLVEERPEIAAGTARMLSVYVRELSKEYPAKEMPADLPLDQIEGWVRALSVQRSDMEKAVQTLGRLRALAPEIVEIDLRYANLQAFDLWGLDFQKADFSGAHLQGSQLRMAQMQGVHLRMAQMQRAHLVGAQMREAYLSEAQLQEANLAGAQLQEANLSGAKLQGAYLRGAQLQGANLGRAWMQGANLGGAQMREADLSRAELQGAYLWEAQLQGANLGRAQMREANLGRAWMQGADLSGAQLQGANLGGAQLQGASLSRAQMQGADLYETQLQGAKLGRAQLQGAGLDLAQLQGANLEEVKVDASTDLMAANFAGVAVRNIDWSSVRLAQDQVDTLFGDSTVILPDNIKGPDWFAEEYGDLGEFYDHWHAWQKKHGFDGDPSKG